MEQMQKQLQQLGEQNQQLAAENTSLKIDGTMEMLKLHAKVKDGEERNITKKYQADTQAVTEQLKAFVQAQKDMMDGKLKATDLVMQSHQDQISNMIKAFEAQTKADKEVQAQERAASSKRRPKQAQFRKVQDGVYNVKIGDASGVIEKSSDGTYVYREMQ
jgi:esterase/lipase